MKELENNISELISSSIENIGYEVVRVKFIEAKTLQIMIDMLDKSRDIQVDDCEKVSHLTSAILDVEDIIDFKYSLEVSSPGIDRPLIKLQDFERFKNFDAKFWTTEPILKSKKFKAKIVDVIENNIKVIMQNNLEETLINFNLIESAKLVLSDELIEASKNTNKI